jgi:glycosyltransferase involved in cell wall biosynthesis
MGLTQASAGTTLTARRSKAPQVVVVHRSARDAYEVSRALSEAGLLETLVTDFYWPADRRWARLAASLLPASARNILAARNNPALPSRQVTQLFVRGSVSQALDKLGYVPFSWRRRATRWTDSRLGHTAGKIATHTNSLLLSYSYYGYDAFSGGSRGLLFQLHPHPVSVRRILQHELQVHPECASSLKKEWELSLPEKDFERLVNETQLADSFLAASSFTCRTLIENGVAPELISVVPYGIDLTKFFPSTHIARQRGPLKLLFVGTINQRKGIKYLVEALQLLRTKQVELTVCGRVVDDLSVFTPVAAQVHIRPSVSYSELLAAYQNADLFVLPSVAEGFGQVLLESLACGLPILGTTHTAAPDLIDEGIQGFVVEPGRPDLLAARIEWALQHRADVDEMRYAARQRAEQFTWQRFRQGIVAAVLKHQAASANDSAEVFANHV